jgi:hypothetical protein
MSPSRLTTVLVGDAKVITQPVSTLLEVETE